MPNLDVKTYRATIFIIVLLLCLGVLDIVNNSIMQKKMISSWFTKIIPSIYFLQFGFITGFLLWLGLQHFHPFVEEKLGSHDISTVVSNTILTAFSLVLASYITGIIKKLTGIYIVPSWKQNLIGFLLGRGLFLLFLYITFGLVSTKVATADS